MVFSRQDYWTGLPCPPPGDLPDPGIKPRSPALQVDSLQSEPPRIQFLKAQHVGYPWEDEMSMSGDPALIPGSAFQDSK